MGLRQGDSGRPDRRAGASWLVFGMAAMIAIGLGICGDAGREWLAWDRGAIAGGQLWRLFSGHFVHLGTSHLALNLAGLALVTYLVGPELRAAEWLAVWLVALTAVSLGLWALDPGLDGYVGLSGVLHGLLAAGVTACWGRWQAEHWIIAVALVAKLLYEQVFGALPGSAETAGGAVIVDAHLYGAIGGAVAGLVLLHRVRRRPAI